MRREYYFKSLSFCSFAGKRRLDEVHYMTTYIALVHIVVRDDNWLFTRTVTPRHQPGWQPVANALEPFNSISFMVSIAVL